MPDSRYVFQPVLYQALTPIHVGSGQDVGIVDLPVIRERTTDHPYLPGSGIRGAMRARSRSQDGEEMVTRLFGNDDPQKISAGCLSVLDAHLLLFPVRSAPGLFHWITCPFLLKRHRQLHHQLCGGDGWLPAPPEAAPEDGHYLGPSGGKLYLEEYPFESGEVSWRWTVEIEDVDPDRVVLLSDEDFLHFARTATLVRQRNRLSTAKTVIPGALFSVEALPAETVLLGYLGATEERVPDPGSDSAASGESTESTLPLEPQEALTELSQLLDRDGDTAQIHLQLGGDESVGLGITRLSWRAP